MMIYLAQVSVCTGIFYGIFYLFYQDKLNHTFNRFFILFSIVIAFSVPLLNLPLFPAEFGASQLTFGSEVSNQLIGVEKQTFYWQNIFLSIYILGLSVSLIIAIKRFTGVYNILKSGDVERHQDYTKLFVDDSYPIGSFFTFLIIPKKRRNEISRYEIFHEECHISQWHSMDVVLLELASIILWFNPFIYMFRQRAREIHEYLADQLTAERFGRENYFAFLINRAQIRHSSRLINNFYSLIKKRLLMIKSEKRIKNWQRIFIAPALFLCLTLFSFAPYDVKEIEVGPEYMAIDSLPVDSIDSKYISYDTIITFDPETYVETLKVVKRDSRSLNQQIDDGMKVRSGIDTIMIFDPKTYQKTMIIVNNDTGDRDTIRIKK